MQGEREVGLLPLQPRTVEPIGLQIDPEFRCDETSGEPFAGQGLAGQLRGDFQIGQPNPRPDRFIDDLAGQRYRSAQVRLMAFDADAGGDREGAAGRYAPHGQIQRAEMIGLATHGVLPVDAGIANANAGHGEQRQGAAFAARRFAGGGQVWRGLPGGRRQKIVPVGHALPVAGQAQTQAVEGDRIHLYLPFQQGQHFHADGHLAHFQHGRIPETGRIAQRHLFGLHAERRKQGQPQRPGDHQLPAGFLLHQYLELLFVRTRIHQHPQRHGADYRQQQNASENPEYDLARRSGHGHLPCGSGNGVNPLKAWNRNRRPSSSVFVVVRVVGEKRRCRWPEAVGAPGHRHPVWSG